MIFCLHSHIMLTHMHNIIMYKIYCLLRKGNAWDLFCEFGKENNVFFCSYQPLNAFMAAVVQVIANSSHFTDEKLEK